MRTSSAGRWLVAAAALMVSVLDVRGTVAQGLGDVARAEAERRKQVTSGRAYTNDDLSAEARAEAEAAPPQPEPPAASAPAAPKPESPGGFVMEEDPKAGIVNVKSPSQARPKRDEQYWRGRLKEIRQRQAKLQSDLAATEQRLTALEGGAQTPLIERERQLTAAALERLRANVRLGDQEMTQLKTMAEAAKIPMDWIQ